MKYLLFFICSFIAASEDRPVVRRSHNIYRDRPIITGIDRASGRPRIVGACVIIVSGVILVYKIPTRNT